MKAIQPYKVKKTAKSELGFKKGDVMKVLKCSEDGFKYYGTLGSKAGWFPYIYVERMGDIGASLKAPEPTDKERRHSIVTAVRSRDAVGDR